MTLQRTRVVGLNDEFGRSHRLVCHLWGDFLRLGYRDLRLGGPLTAMRV
jgi:hypothetical protein